MRGLVMRRSLLASSPAAAAVCTRVRACAGLVVQGPGQLLALHAPKRAL